MEEMGAAEVGARLLAEVEEEGLDELLHSLRCDVEAKEEQKSWLGIPALDRILRVFERQKGSGSHPPVVEITSVAPASGKTHLLYLLTAVAVLPPHRDGVKPTKFPGCVVVFDADDRFNVERLAEIMYHRLCGDSDNADVAEEEIMAIVRSALQHVHIFRPQSLGSLITTVQDLPEYLLTSHYHYSSSRSLDLVLIDSISSYFWQEKLAEETARINADTESGQLHANEYISLITELRELQSLFGCSVVAASWGLSPASSTNHVSRHTLSFRSLLPAAWQNLCTLRLVVAQDHVRQFPLGMSVEQARKDAGNRQTIVDQGRFTAWVDEWNSDHWSAELREDLRNNHRNRAFFFRITLHGVDVHDYA